MTSGVFPTWYTTSAYHGSTLIGWPLYTKRGVKKLVRPWRPRAIYVHLRWGPRGTQLLSGSQTGRQRPWELTCMDPGGSGTFEPQIYGSFQLGTEFL